MFAASVLDADDGPEAYRAFVGVDRLAGLADPAEQDAAEQDQLDKNLSGRMDRPYPYESMVGVASDDPLTIRAARVIARRVRECGYRAVLAGVGRPFLVARLACWWLRTHPGRAVSSIELTTVGEHHDIMDVTPDGYTDPHIEHRRLVKLAARSLAGVAHTVLERNGLDLDDVDWVIPHSGTAGVQAMLRAELGVSPGRVLTNLPAVGNVSSAAIPVAVDHYAGAGIVRPGQLILSASVGFGFYAAAAPRTRWPSWWPCSAARGGRTPLAR